MDEHEDDQSQIKSPIKRYGSTRKIYLFNSKYDPPLEDIFVRLSFTRENLRVHRSPVVN